MFASGKLKIENNKLFDDDDVIQTVRRSSNNNNNYDKSNVYNLIQPGDNLYYDESSYSNNKNDKDNKATVLEVNFDAPRPELRETDEDAAAKAAEEKIKTIAFNSREYRLVGPQQKEVEMKEDVGTKMMIALENLGKEATDVWEQVNTKLDKGWTDFKTMIDGALSNSKKSSP